MNIIVDENMLESVLIQCIRSGADLKFCVKNW